MEILLFVSLLMLFAGSFWLEKFDLRSPTVLFNAAWVMASFFYMICHDSWGSYLSVKTYLLIVMGNTAFNLPFLVKTRCKKDNPTVISAERQPDADGRVHISVMTECLILLYILASIAFCWNRVAYLAGIVGTPDGVSDVLEMARFATTKLEYSYGRIMVNMLRLNGVLAVIIFGFFIKDYFRMTWPQRTLSTAIVLLASASLLLGAGRSQLFRVFLGIMVLSLFHVYDRIDWANARSVLRMLMIVAGSVVAFLIVFAVVGVYLLGRGDDNGIQTVVQQITKYVGSPIMGLNYFLENRSLYGTSYFGANTFMSIYMFLSKTVHLINLEPAPTFLPYIEGTRVSTNVYTMYYQYFYDFGMIGALLLPGILGAVYCKLFYGAKKHGVLYKLIYADLVYCVVFSFFAESFFSGINTNVVRIAMILIVYYGIYMMENIFAKMKRRSTHDHS